MRALAILLAGALGSCTCGTLSQDELAERYPYAQGRLFSRGGLAPVLAELEAKLGAPPEVNHVSIGPGSITFEVRDPKKPGNLDRWWYDHGWHDPEPVQTSRQNLEDARSFRLSEVTALGKLRDLIELALAELKIEGGRIDGVSVSKTDKITLRIDIKGPRERGSVTFDATGALIGKHVD